METALLMITIAGLILAMGILTYQTSKIVDGIELRLWKLENPPRFKVGDRPFIKRVQKGKFAVRVRTDSVIVKVEVVNRYIFAPRGHCNDWSYTYYNPDTNEVNETYFDSTFMQEGGEK